MNERYEYHGHACRGFISKTYKTWAKMLSKVRGTSGGRNHKSTYKKITTIKRWYSFTNFLKDMGPRPDNCELRRVNTKLGFTPSNCRWKQRRKVCGNGG